MKIYKFLTQRQLKLALKDVVQELEYEQRKCYLFWDNFELCFNFLEFDYVYISRNVEELKMKRVLRTM